MIRRIPPDRTLRSRPDLQQLKRQAKELLAAFVAGRPDAVAEVNACFRNVDHDTFALHDAQLVLARSYGFDSWRKLKAYVDGVTVTRLAEAVRAGAVAEVRAMLRARPELVHMELSAHNEHRALHFAVLNRGAEMVRVLMEHGADARKGIYPHRDATTALAIATDRGYGDIDDIIHQYEQRRRAATSGRSSPPQANDVEDVCNAIGRGEHTRALAMLDADPALTNSSRHDGWGPLHVAAATLDTRMVACCWSTAPTPREVTATIRRRSIWPRPGGSGDRTIALSG